MLLYDDYTVVIADSIRGGDSNSKRLSLPGLGTVKQILKLNSKQSNSQSSIEQNIQTDGARSAHVAWFRSLSLFPKPGTGLGLPNFFLNQVLG